MKEKEDGQPNVNLAQTWRQDGCSSLLLQKDIRRIHDGLKNPQNETIRRLLRKLHDVDHIPNEVKYSIKNLIFNPFADTPELPRKPNLYCSTKFE